MFFNNIMPYGSINYQKLSSSKLNMSYYCAAILIFVARRQISNSRLLYLGMNECRNECIEFKECIYKIIFGWIYSGIYACSSKSMNKKCIHAYVRTFTYIETYMSILYVMCVTMLCTQCMYFLCDPCTLFFLVMLMYIYISNCNICRAIYIQIVYKS